MRVRVRVGVSAGVKIRIRVHVIKIKFMVVLAEEAEFVDPLEYFYYNISGLRE